VPKPKFHEQSLRSFNVMKYVHQSDLPYLYFFLTLYHTTNKWNVNIPSTIPLGEKKNRAKKQKQIFVATL